MDNAGRASLSDYVYRVIGNVVVIYDENNGRMTVTNDIENVLRDIGKTIDLTNMKIIYRDSMGVFDGVTLENERFYPINKTSLEEALTYIGEPCGS